MKEFTAIPPTDSSNWQPEFSVAFLLQIINSISNPIFVKDNQHVWVFVNDAFCDFSGHSREDLLGKSDYDFFSKQQADVFWQIDELIFTTGIANENEGYFTDAFGLTHIISTKKSLFEDRISNKFLVGTIQDITQKIEKQQQAQEALKQSKEALAVAYAQMETLVLERTKELAQTNEALQAEIAQHEETELALRESEEKLQKLAANMPGMLFQFLLQPDGSMSMPYVSSGSYEIYGLTPEQIQAEINLIISTIHPDHRQDYEESVAVSARTLQPFRWEGRAVLSCGQVKWIKCLSRPEAQANGNILWHGVILDVTERKLAEKELRASQQRLALLVEQTPIGVIEWNTKFEVQEWNSAAEKIFGYTKVEVLGRNFEFLVQESKRKYVKQVLADLLSQQGDINSTNENITKDGQVIICEWYNNPLVTQSGEVIGVASMVLDITERKRALEEQQKAEEAVRKSEARLRQQAKELEQALDELQRTQIHLVQSAKMSSLGQLVAGIAHEINNPVNFIYGNLCHTEEYTKELLKLLQLYQQPTTAPVKEIEDFVELIELDFLKQDLQQILNSMKVGAERIRSIVLSLRTFSRLDEAEMKTVNIHEGIDSALMILQSRLNRIGIDAKQLEEQNRPTIEVSKEYGNLPLVECYAGQLNQVFLNILTNAIDAIEESFVICHLSLVRNLGQMTSPTIRIHTELIEPNQVKILIADNGVGIPQELQERIFDPFFTTKPVGKGVGLGLAISYQIVTERHGGSLECISAPGQGSEFMITIPLFQS